MAAVTPDGSAQAQPVISEFQRIYQGGLDGVIRLFDDFTNDYPLITTICMVAFMALGIFSILSFSIAAVVSGATLAALSLALGKNIFSDPGKFWERLQPSLSAIFTCGANDSKDVDNNNSEAEGPQT